LKGLARKSTAPHARSVSTERLLYPLLIRMTGRWERIGCFLSCEHRVNPHSLCISTSIKMTSTGSASAMRSASLPVLATWMEENKCRMTDRIILRKSGSSSITRILPEGPTSAAIESMGFVVCLFERCSPVRSRGSRKKAFRGNQPLVALKKGFSKAALEHPRIRAWRGVWQLCWGVKSDTHKYSVGRRGGQSHFLLFYSPRTLLG